MFRASYSKTLFGRMSSYKRNSLGDILEKTKKDSVILWYVIDLSTGKCVYEHELMKLPQLINK